MDKWFDCLELENPAYCAWCGAKTPKSFAYLEVAPGEEYRGNALVVSRRPFPWKGKEELRLNRGTYVGFKYGAFCKLRCAEAFANSAHKAGYRVKEN